MVPKLLYVYSYSARDTEILDIPPPIPPSGHYVHLGTVQWPGATFWLSFWHLVSLFGLVLQDLPRVIHSVDDRFSDKLLSQKCKDK